jgi:hypothetical protein
LYAEWDKVISIPDSCLPFPIISLRCWWTVFWCDIEQSITGTLDPVRGLTGLFYLHLAMNALIGLCARTCHAFCLCGICWCMYAGSAARGSNVSREIVSLFSLMRVSTVLDICVMRLTIMNYRHTRSRAKLNSAEPLVLVLQQNQRYVCAHSCLCGPCLKSTAYWSVITELCFSTDKVTGLHGMSLSILFGMGHHRPSRPSARFDRAYRFVFKLE